jgi:hypothetical protein
MAIFLDIDTGGLELVTIDIRNAAFDDIRSAIGNLWKSPHDTKNETTARTCTGDRPQSEMALATAAGEVNRHLAPIGGGAQKSGRFNF